MDGGAMEKIFAILGSVHGTGFEPTPSEMASGIGESMCEASYSLASDLSRISAQPAVFTSETSRPSFL